MVQTQPLIDLLLVLFVTGELEQTDSDRNCKILLVMQSMKTGLCASHLL